MLLKTRHGNNNGESRSVRRVINGFTANGTDGFTLEHQYFFVRVFWIIFQTKIALKHSVSD